MIGIGITTRARPHILKIALEHFRAFFPEEEVVTIVIDDNSTKEDAEKNLNHCAEYGFSYFYSEKRLGVAKAKNACLSRLRNCDHIFLFDDDCFPKQKQWEKVYIEATQCTGVQHFQYNIEVAGIKLKSEKNSVEVFDASAGVMLYITKDVLKRVGGFNPAYGIYGYEHDTYTEKINRAGFQKDYGRHLTPKNAKHYLYSLDLNLNHRGENPPFYPDFIRDHFTHSLRGEEGSITDYIRQNGKVSRSGDYHDFN